MRTRSRASGYRLRTSTISMNKDYEEDFGDFPSENRDNTAESSVGAYRAESTDQWTAGSRITAKNSTTL